MSPRFRLAPVRRAHQTTITVLAGVALLAAACGVGATDTAVAPPTRPPVTQPTDPPTAPPPTGPSDCPAVEPLGHDVSPGEDFSGDLDGDGTADTIAVYTADDGAAFVEAKLATGETVRALLEGTSGGAVELLGLHDLDRDGNQEVFTRANGGGADVMISIHDLTDCELRAVTIGGAAAAFPIATTGSGATGLSCAEGYVDDLYFAELTSTDGRTYEGRITAYDLEGGALTETGGEGAAYSSDGLASIAGVHCGDLAF